MALQRVPYTPTYPQANVHNVSILKLISLIFGNLFAKCILRDNVTFIKFLNHNLELLGNSTIYWDDPRTCNFVGKCGNKVNSRDVFERVGRVTVNTTFFFSPDGFVAT